ncbi:MAG: hypothetical protein ACQERN_11630 [Thermodesulfobacteriota bacterium]
MKKQIAILLVWAWLIPGLSLAGPMFNPYSDTWETPEAGARLQYNPMEKVIVYAPDQSTLQHNQFEDLWQLVPPDYILKYNPYTKGWERVAPDAQLYLNPMTNTWEYRPLRDAAETPY